MMLAQILASCGGSSTSAWLSVLQLFLWIRVCQMMTNPEEVILPAVCRMVYGLGFDCQLQVTSRTRGYVQRFSDAARWSPFLFLCY